MKRARALCAAVVALTLLSAGAAHADDEEAANKEFQRGVELYRTKKYKDAADAFVRAERFAPRGPTAYNAARAFKAAGDTLRAADELAAALRYGGLGDDQKKDATEQLRVMEAASGAFELSGPKDATVRIGNREEKVPTRIHVAPGPYVIQFTSGATIDEQQLTVRKGERLSVEMRLLANPKDTQPLPPPSAAQPAPAANNVVVPAREKPPASTMNLRKPIAIGLMGAGGIMFISAIAVGVGGLSARDRFVESGLTNIALHDEAERQRTLANVLGVIGVLAIGGGIVLYVTAPKSTTTGEVEPQRKRWVGVSFAPNGAALVGTLP